MCITGDECEELNRDYVENMASRAVQVLQADDQMTVSLEIKSDADTLSEDEFAAIALDTLKDNLAALKASSSAFAGLTEDMLSAQIVAVATTVTPSPLVRAIVAEDDDLSGGAIAAIVIGLLVFVGLVVGIAMGAGGSKPAQEVEANEPIDEEKV